MNSLHKKQNFIRKTYDWVLRLSESKHSMLALFLLAVAESSFFPIPPDVLLIILAAGLPKKAFKYALVCSIGSVIGGVIGYCIGWQFMTSIGIKIVNFYGFTEKMNYIGVLYSKYDAWAISIAGFTPIPYKVFTITAGLFKINFLVFFISSMVSRSARFFLVAGLIYFFGPKIQKFIDKYFNLLTIVFTILFVLGFVLIKILL